MTFRAEIEYVEVDAVVTDERGNLVKGLTRDDFDVYEDGKLQKVSFFSQVVIPVERLDRFVSESRPIVPDVRSNARPFEGRIYVLMLDNYHTAALRSALVKKAAHEFVDKYLGANDVAAVIHTSGGVATLAGVHQRSAAAARLDRSLHRPEAAARARWSASTNTTATRCCSSRPTVRPAGTPRSSTRATANGATTPARRSARCAAWPTSWDRSAAGARRS